VREVRTRDRPGRGCREKMIVEETARPVGPYTHALVTYCFVKVARLKGRPGPDAGEVPNAFDDQARQPVTTACGPSSGMSALTSEPRSVGEVVYGEGRFVGAGIKRLRR
jgi:hypothetical protein